MLPAMLLNAFLIKRIFKAEIALVIDFVVVRTGDDLAAFKLMIFRQIFLH